MLWKKIITAIKEEFSGKDHELYHLKNQKTLVLLDGEGEIIKQSQVNDDVKPKFIIQWIINIAVSDQEKDYDIETEGNDYLN